ncbi:thioredoxin domain-containing protein [Streptomyces sp. SID14478]|uniref:DsbA family protein n=1 Tax=Streptomyces sp. SID14478 TaxID=2706073 RepID=UPI0013E0B000|nr:thioredoxin domain-containing protein [Streptomyces sp. SID14478]NEB81830.1 thioredoxin domain-containing protein [Streptomyces sp. SID14478]
MRVAVRGVGAVAVAVTLGGVLAACSSGGTSSQGGGEVTEVHAVDDSASLAGAPVRVDGGVITVGEADAPHTVKVYEDARCPFCKKFEEGGARALVKPVADGDVKVEYTIASFLDKALGGSGSVNAANALRASVDAGRFPEFHAAVFAHQPADEAVDAYTNGYLLKIAGKVDGLRGAAFDKAVNDGSYEKWVGRAMKSFRDDGVRGTPTVVIDGKKAGGDEDAMYAEAAFAEVLKKAGIEASS